MKKPLQSTQYCFVEDGTTIDEIRFVVRNLLLTTHRAILRNPRGSIINISAVAIGICSVLFVANLLQYEMSYDHHMNDVFRVEMKNSTGPGSLDAYTLSHLGPELVKKVDNIQKYARLIPFSEYKSAQLRYLSDTSSHAVYFKRAYYADLEVINFFKVAMVTGHRGDFEKPGSMIISQTVAQALFGADWKTRYKDAELNHGKGSIQQTYKLVGVFADRQENTHLDLDALISMATPGSGEGTLSGYTYVSGFDILSLTSLDTLNFRPASVIHTSPGISNEAEPVANKSLLLLLSVVAVIILLITITNYINSSIIHFIDRCKEVGIRKLHGASTGDLTMRLLVELLSINLISALVGLGLFAFCAYSMNRYHLLTYPTFDQTQWTVLFVLLAFTIIFNTFISAIYPHIFLKNIGITSALKGIGSLLRARAFSYAGNVVRALLVFQIVASIVFLSASLIIYRQLSLIDSQPTGQEVAITGIFPGLSGANDQFTQTAVGFLDEMSRLGIVNDYSFSNLYKGKIKSESKIMLEDSTKMYLTVVDPDYWKASDRMIAGNGFDFVFGQNPGHVILDSTIAQDRFGFNNETKTWLIEGGRYETIGIIHRSKEQVLRGFVSGFRYLTYLDLVLNYQGRSGETLDEFLKKTEYVISTRFPHFFLERRELEASGKAEKEVLALFVFFGAISVLVAAIGIFGLSYFITQKKSREVGIRKIHGASSIQILIGLLTDFVRLILLGGMLASPLVYFGGKYWLQNYANRIDLDITIFLLPVAGICAITILTVLDKSWKAATLNPIEILDEK